MPSTPPDDKSATGSPVHLKLQRDGFLNGRRCATLEIATTTTDIDDLLRDTRKTAKRLIVPKDFSGDAAALVLRTDLQNHELANLHVLALGLAAGIICKRHANRNRNAAATTVWACLRGWQRDGATRVYRNRPRPLKARESATFLPTDKPQPGGNGEAGHHPSTAA